MADIKKIRLSGVTYNIVDESAVHSLAGYATSAETEAAITAATNALAESIAEQGYQNASQVSATVDAAVSGKADTTAVTASIEAATSGKVETSTFNTYTASTANAIADKFDDVDYNSQTKRINFYSGGKTTGTIKAYIDATDFIKDGMVDNVEVKTIQSGGTDVAVLAITFNADSGKQEIDIPISQIFDASNYYTTAQTQAYVTGYTYDKATIDQKIGEGGTFDPTQYYTTANTYSKTEVDNEISAATSGKSDTTAVTAINDTLTAHTADTSIHVTTSDKSTWNGKQDALVSGTNIKTVGGTTVLGSGNIALMTASIGTGNDSETLIFDFA